MLGEFDGADAGTGSPGNAATLAFLGRFDRTMARQRFALSAEIEIRKLVAAFAQVRRFFLW